MSPERYVSAVYAAGISKKLSLTEFDREAAALLRVDQRTARRYRAGSTSIPGPVEVALEALGRLKRQKKPRLLQRG